MMRARRLRLAFVVMMIWMGVGDRAVASGAPGASEITTARDLLVALETADEGVSTLQAGVRYIRRMALQGDEQTRQGRLYFEQIPNKSGGAARRLFAVYFDTLYVDARKERDRQDWVFTGAWLIERRPDVKQYVARQLAPPGRQIDPLKLGEGPLPIPIGQKAADVLSRYDVKLVNPHAGLEEESGGVQEFVQDTWQLRLTPKAGGAVGTDGADGGEYREIRLWYDRASLLPRLAKTISRSGDEAFVMLVNIRVNDKIKGDVFTIKQPDKADGWDVQIEEYRGK